jgi:hypothetical protein
LRRRKLLAIKIFHYCSRCRNQCCYCEMAWLWKNCCRYSRWNQQLLALLMSCERDAGEV